MPAGGDHELLDVSGVLGVLAAVEDVEHGHGQGHPFAEVAVEWHAAGCRRRVGDCQRHAKDCVLRPSPTCRGVPSASSSRWSTVLLVVGRGGPATARAKRRSTFSTAFANARAAEPGGVAVAELDGLVLAGCWRPRGRRRGRMRRRTGERRPRPWGLPRESRTSRARTSLIVAVILPPAWKPPRPNALSTASTGESARMMAVSLDAVDAHAPGVEADDRRALAEGVADLGERTVGAVNGNDRSGRPWRRWRLRM